MLDKPDRNPEFRKLLEDSKAIGPVEVVSYHDFAEAVWLLRMANMKGISPSAFVAEIVSKAAFGGVS